ncbi:metallophosphoesterase family protein [Aliikangiella marina]|uniref:Metallophosphoesterase family protein n=1 Tax=Aliikangiella marina TaxID=1712262 RepID=A0A545TJ72_9GAMM|nr:metallophosphoesterase family protein [Aliikangiella marina]TQV77279.1 metallophosphoesterase family protein [Aliikangiella marina]
MERRIGIISDPHATFAPLEQALQIFTQQSVETVYCLGDVAGYGQELRQALTLLMGYNVNCILGNHEAWLLEEGNAQQLSKEALSFIQTWPRYHECIINNVALHLSHSSPYGVFDKGIRLLNKTGTRDNRACEHWQMELKKINLQANVLLVGHTHQIFAERLNDTLVVNPGSCLFNHSCLILNLPSMDIEWINLSNKSLIKNWHWGHQI